LRVNVCKEIQQWYQTFRIGSTGDFDRQKRHFWIAHAKIEKTCLLKKRRTEKRRTGDVKREEGAGSLGTPVDAW
jgi:hypothetical protein